MNEYKQWPPGTPFKTECHEGTPLTDAEKANRFECQLISALHHIRQLLLSERPPSEVAWWLRANHPDYMAGTDEHRRAALSALADLAEQ